MGKINVIELLSLAKEQRASDLHLVASSPALFRIDGSLVQANGCEPLTPEDIEDAFNEITTENDRNYFKEHRELDFAYSMPGAGYFRCNAARQRGAISLAIRLLPPRVPTIDELELPQICKHLIMRKRGLIITTGPTGSGKSTTLAAMIQHLNLNESRHIITIEDPIEYVYTPIKCAITQRELGNDTLSYPKALRHILRQDPDVILVGEMRDADTANAVINVAETGHLVLTSGHAPSAAQAMERVIDLFPPHERPLVQSRLASLLIGVLCQSLVPRADDTGRISAVEIMLANSAVKNLIREGKIYQLNNVIRTYTNIGMISMDEALVRLYLKGVINGKTLFEFCNDRKEISRLIEQPEQKPSEN